MLNGNWTLSFLLKSFPIAPVEAVSRRFGTEVKKFSFPVEKERPTEAPFWAWKTCFLMSPDVSE